MGTFCTWESTTMTEQMPLAMSNHLSLWLEVVGSWLIISTSVMN